MLLLLSPPRDLANDVADISLASEGTQSQLELPEHDELFICHGGGMFKRGEARPAKQRERSLNTWYWKHGEEIYEDKQNIGCVSPSICVYSGRAMKRIIHRWLVWLLTYYRFRQ